MQVFGGVLGLRRTLVDKAPDFTAHQQLLAYFHMKRFSALAAVSRARLMTELFHHIFRA